MVNLENVRLKDEAAEAGSRTHPVLAEAGKLMLAYGRATGARICVNDHNGMPIREVFGEISSEKNICLFCMKHRNNIVVNDIKNFRFHPCKEMHYNAAKEAERCGGSYLYTCDLGFMFWTSPVYVNEHFIGALIGTGFLGIEKNETVARMREISGGTVPEAELQKIADSFPLGIPWKIKSLSELVLICAKSLSAGSDDSYSAMRRRAQQQSDIAAMVEELKTKYPAETRPEYPMDKERRLLDTLKKGDTQSARETLNELLAFLIFSNSSRPAPVAEATNQKHGKEADKKDQPSPQEQFRNIKYRATELAILLNRLDIGPGLNSETALKANSQHIKTIQETQDIEELTDALHRIVDHIAAQIFSFQGVRHASALKKAEYYIRENFSGKISLKEIAKASGFSAPYFSTIFKEEMGENFSSYLNRLRVEKASYMLTETDLSMSAISGACGFEDQSWFSKIFKLHTGMSPGKYRSLGGKTESKIPEMEFSDDYRLLTGQKHVPEGNLGSGEPRRQVPARQGHTPAGA